MGTLLVYEVKSQVKQIAVVGGISVIDYQNHKASQSQPESLVERRRITIPE